MAESAAAQLTAVRPPTQRRRRSRVRAMTWVPLLDSAYDSRGPPGPPGVGRHAMGKPLVWCEVPQGRLRGWNRPYRLWETWGGCGDFRTDPGAQPSPRATATPIPLSETTTHTAVRPPANALRWQVKAIRRFTVRPVLPEPLRPLSDLARNLRWSWHTETRDLFQSVDPERWAASGGDPVRLLGSVR